MKLDWDDLIFRLPRMLQKLERSRSLQVGGDLSSLPSHLPERWSEEKKHGVLKRWLRIQDESEQDKQFIEKIGG